jgi:hypothetical protein
VISSTYKLLWACDSRYVIQVQPLGWNSPFGVDGLSQASDRLGIMVIRKYVAECQAVATFGAHLRTVATSITPSTLIETRKIRPIC